MESDAFVTCLDALRQGRSCVLATILRQDGSAPRGAGATMAVLENGQTVGTVGGGALEFQAAQRALACLKEKRSALTDYRLASGADQRLNMVCGGAVTILCQLAEPGDKEILFTLTVMEAAQKEPGSLWLVRRICPQSMDVEMGLYTDGGPLAEPMLSPEQETALRGRQAALWEGETLVFVQPLWLAGHAYVFGGGHVAQKLVPLLDELEFAPVVFEDRPEFAAKELFPRASRIILGSFSAVGESVALTEADAAVIMTRGHAYDNLLLAQVLRDPVWYAGLMGSRSKIAATRSFLLGEGLSEKDVARLHTPVGLAIGAETPAEIAVSVAAEMVLCRARRNHSRKLPAE